MIRAAERGHKDIVEYLVSQGADKDMKNDVSTTLVHEHLYKMIYFYICMYRYRYAPIVLLNQYISMCVCTYICMYANICRYVHSFLYLYYNNHA